MRQKIYRHMKITETVDMIIESSGLDTGKALDYAENIPLDELLEMARISGFVNRQKGLGRPTKKDGRELSKFTDDMYSYSDAEFYFDDDFFDDDDDE